MLDFNHRATCAEQINAIIDAALQTERGAASARTYLGGSRLGVPCERALQFEFTGAPKDEGSHFKGQTLRIFAAGHTFEDLTIAWMRDAGFDLRTRRRDGGQFGFETAGGRVKGHIDGVIVSGPDVGVTWPALFEHKALKARSWSDVVKRGVELSKPVYYAQLQLYMAYMQLEVALFTCLNKDTQELHHEKVSFVPHIAQGLSDKAVEIICAAETNDLPPRIAASPDFHVCRFCPFHTTCWEASQ